MTARRLTVFAATLALAAGTALAAAPAGSASTHPSLGHRSLAKVLTSDGNKLDHNSGDFDITTEAVLAVLAAKPTSAVGVLTKGNVALTAFVPTDQAFRVFVYDLTGKWLIKEKNVFAAVASLGIDTVETVLRYHVVVGKAILAKDVLTADGANLTTAAGGAITVDVLAPNWPVIRLQDLAPNDVDPFTVPKLLNINKGNKQVPHGISYVLRPADL